jgi:hypothetical protein
MLAAAALMSVGMSTDMAAAGPDAAEPVRVVTLSVLGRDDPGLSEVLEELLERVRLTLRPSSEIAPDATMDVVARVVVDERSDDAIGVSVVDGRQGLMVLERILPMSNSEVLRDQEIALVVRSGLDSILARSAVRNPRSSEPPPIAAVRPTSPRSPTTRNEANTWELHIGPVVDAHTFSRGLPPLIGGGFEAQFFPVMAPPHLGIWFEAMLHATTTATLDGAEAHATMSSLRLGASVAPVWRQALRVYLGVGGGLDLANVATLSIAPGTVAAPASAWVDPVASAQAALQMQLTAEIGLFLAFAGDVDLAPSRYVVDNAGVHDAVFDPFQVRVVALAGFDFRISEPRVHR